MSRCSASPLHRVSWVGALFIAAALVLVPTIARARQHVELRETTRLSIRLNWQSDAPPRMMSAAPQPDRADLVVPRALAGQPHPPRVAPRTHALDEPVIQTLLDNAPDPLRGPPSLHPSDPSAFAAL